MRIKVCLALAITLGFAGSAVAQQDKYTITSEERTACQGDATLLCSDAYPDEDRLIVCMRRNRAQLSRVCLRAFDAGMRKRHLS